MKQSMKFTIGLALMTITMAAVTVHADDTSVFTDNAAAKTITSGYQQTEDFFMKNVFGKNGESTKETKNRLQENKKQTAKKVEKHKKVKKQTK